MTNPGISKISDSIYVFQDVCNVYILKHGSSALLIDFGSGKVLERLIEIGVDQVSAILHTHHHREQAQGDSLAVSLGIPIYVPGKEIDLFRNAESYWRDGFQVEHHCLGVPNVRPVRNNVEVAGELTEGTPYCYGPYQMEVVETPGDTKGSLSFVVQDAGRRYVFSGDLIMNGGKVVNFYDSEWDYGYCEGLKAVAASCRKLSDLEPDVLLPSHGEMIQNGKEELLHFAARLDVLIEDYLLRDYDSSEEMPLITKPLPFTDKIDRVSEHLLRWQEGYGNMYILLGESGEALLIDAGIIHYGKDRQERESYFKQQMDQLMKKMHITRLRAVIPTHIHGDHLDIFPFLHTHYGTELWCADRMADVIENPERYNLFALMPSYQLYEEPLTINRRLSETDELVWEQYRFELVHLPGQTYYAIGIVGEIDGVRCVFSGDNLFYSSKGSGHDAVTWRNKAILEEGYLKCALTLQSLKPERLLCGHSFIIDNPESQITKLYDWAVSLREQLRSFSAEPEYEWGIDPYWLQIYPYQTCIEKETNEFPLTIRITNHHYYPAAAIAQLVLPQGWISDGDLLKARIPARESTVLQVQVRVPEGEAPGRYPITCDVTMNGKRYGELFDAVVIIGDSNDNH